MDGFEVLALVLAVVVIVLLLWVRSIAGRVARLERGFEFGPDRPKELSVLSAGEAGSAADSSGAGGSVVSTPGHPSAAVLAYLATGQKIPAIKQYRIETGVGLKEAKDAVEEIERNVTINA